MARASWNGVVLADSDDVIVIDGYTYFPRKTLRTEYVEPSEHTSRCPWKGDASYYTLRVNGATNQDAAWYYADPKPAAALVRDRVAFWRGVRVEP